MSGDRDSGEEGAAGAQRPPLAVGRPFLAPTPRSAPAVTPPAPGMGRVTPPYLPRELTYTPTRLVAVPPPTTEAPPAGGGPGEGASPLEASPLAHGAGRQAPAVEPTSEGAAPGRDDDEDAWAWGGESAPPAIGEPAAAIAESAFESAGLRPGAVHAEHDWFEQTPAGAPATPSALPVEERAAQTLEALAAQLRAGTLGFAPRAAVDSDEAVLATVLAALFARRAR